MSLLDPRIPLTFLDYAVGILASTAHGLSGNKIVQFTATWAVAHNLNLPHSTYPFDAPNKRTALRDNLLAFKPSVQYEMLKELCDQGFRTRDEVRELRAMLISRFGSMFEPEAVEQVPEQLISETKHWLERHESAFRLYTAAEEKYRKRQFYRNLLDDLRLALESLLKEILGNRKSLENQLAPIGAFVAARGGSAELRNMFVKLVDYYAKYQNTYVKHADAVIEQEVEFVFELTSSFIKHFVRLNEGSAR